MLSDDEYFVVNWVGFSFGILSSTLSVLTLYIIYLMCNEKTHFGNEIANPIVGGNGTLGDEKLYTLTYILFFFAKIDLLSKALYIMKNIIELLNSTGTYS